MRHKILILNLLLSLVFLPVAQAMNLHAMPAEHDHGSMVMDCEHVDPGHCIDFDTCMFGNHASCSISLEAAQAQVTIADRPSVAAYAPELAQRFLSHLPELLLRPPRNA